jgi:hypothetical protein
MTGGLRPISSSWRQAPLRPTTRMFFQLNPCGHSPYVTFSLTRGRVCLLWICLAFRQVYVSHIQHVTENFSFCTIHKSSVSTGFAKQIMPILRVLCYNGSLVTWTVVAWPPPSLSLLYSLSGFAFSYLTNMYILIIPYEFITILFNHAAVSTRWTPQCN